MASVADDTRSGVGFPAPWAFLGLLVLGGVAVLALPQIADDLPHLGRDEQAQYATTCLGVLILSGIYVYLAFAERAGLDRVWLASTVVYVAGLVIVKFILSPTAFQTSSGGSLGAFVTAGLVVMPLYVGGLAIMQRLAAGKRDTWSYASKAGLAAGLAVVAVVTRLVVASVLGNASGYLDSLIGVGVVMPFVVAGASFAVMESYDRAGPYLKDVFYLGTALVLSHHALWVLYMYGLFS